MGTDADLRLIEEQVPDLQVQGPTCTKCHIIYLLSELLEANMGEVQS